MRTRLDTDRSVLSSVQRVRGGPEIVEHTDAFFGRSPRLAPIFEAVRPTIEEFLADPSQLRAAQRRFMLSRGRLEQVEGGFEVPGVLEQLLARPSKRAPQRVHPHMRRDLLPQEGVHPIRQYYEIPAKYGRFQTHILRTLTIDEKKRIIMFLLSDLMREGRLRRVFKKRVGRWIFMLPLPGDGEDTPEGCQESDDSGVD